MASDTEPLLPRGNTDDSDLWNSESPRDKRGLSRVPASSGGRSIHLRKHVTLLHAFGIIVGAVIGSGIFISSKGVAEQLGSPGATLLLWSITGLFALICALCYAELGSSIPQAGGEYAFVMEIFGPRAGFLCLWVHVVLTIPCTYGAIARAGAIYFLQIFGLECEAGLTTLITMLFIGELR